MNNKIAITGIGVVSPFGIGKDLFWDQLHSGHHVISKINRFDHPYFQYCYAGYLHHFNPDFYLPARLSKKIDRFTLYALMASGEAITDSQLNFNQLDKTRIGIYVGNMFGGWEFTDRELRHLYVEGASYINPYLATAWFPAAPQGEISIQQGMKGQSKTIDAGRSSSLISIGQAVKAIQSGRLDIAIAGGTEAMINPFMLTALQKANEIDEKYYLSKNGLYEPFGKIETGWVPGEGSAFVILENVESALSRQAKIYAIFQGMGQASEACDPNTLFQNDRGLTHAILNAIQNSECHVNHIDVVIADGIATQIGDYNEAYILQKYFPEKLPFVTSPKSFFGDLGGATGALDIAMGALMLEKQCILPTANTHGIHEKYDLPIVTHSSIKAHIQNILINSRSHGGIGTAVILGRNPTNHFINLGVNKNEHCI